MPELFHSVDGVKIAAIQSGLEAVGIPSDITTEVRNPYLGTMEFFLWVPNDADLAACDRVCQQVQERQAMGSPVTAVTRVSVSEDMTACKKCQYDLRGQTASGKCPECGYPYELVHQRPCPNCEAMGPSDFAVCWNCGEEIEESSEGAIAPEAEPPADK